MLKSDISLGSKDRDAFVEESICILHEAYVSKKLVLFVGAGVDVYSGMPLWKDAIKEFCSHLNIDSEGVDNLRIPQYYYNARGKKEYVELCRDIFCYEKDLLINEVHKRLVDFGVNTIITTNYTDFIEREMKSRGYIYRVICQDKDLPYAKNENLIIKMHGDFEHDNFVLKEDDYLNYSENFRLIETYIKSIIAKNVVLFVGYSFNDPDVKQLFSWVKNILGGDFQRAYMLEGYNEYDKNVFEYYKNLGVNIIYTHNFDEDAKIALLNILNKVKLGNTDNISNEEVTKNYFIPYLNMNYIMGKYLNKGLNLCNLFIDTGVLRSLDEGKETEANKLLLKISGQVHQTFTTSSEPYDIIGRMLQKSGVDKIDVMHRTGIATGYQYVDVLHTENDLEDLIILFDYAELKKRVEYDDFFSNSDEEQFYLQHAYIYYILEQYEKAYKELCIAAELAFKKQQFYLYYIAQFNKFRIKDYIRRVPKISKEVYKKIDEDLKRVDLNAIIMSIPDSSTNDNQMLKDIGSFQLHYSFFQDAYRISEKVKEQQDTEYTFFSGIPSYFKLQWLVKDYYKYLMYNYLMIDRYQESKEVLVLYVKSILASAATPDKGNDKSNQTGNIHAPEIGIFELFLIIKYMSEKDILNMLGQYEFGRIPINPECNDYIKKALQNLKSEENHQSNSERWNCLAVISYIVTDSELVEDAVDCISDDFNYFSYRTHQTLIHRLLNVCYSNKLFKSKKAGLFKIKDYALGRFLGKIIKQSENIQGSEIVSYSKIIQDVCYYFYDTYKESYDENVDKLICDEKNLIIAKIYPYCGEQNKISICEHFEKWKGDASSYSCEIYFRIVMNNIIEPNEDYEGLIFENINEIKERSRDSFPNDYQDILTFMYNLHMNDKLKKAEELKKIIKESDNDEFIFMSDMDGFDYNKFNLEWLSMFNGKLLEEIANSKVARCNISKKFAEKIESGGVDNRLLKIYFKYFVNITGET